MLSSTSNTWTRLESMSLGRKLHCSGVVNGPDGLEVVVVGGDTGGFGETESVEIFNFNTMAWRYALNNFPSTIVDAGMGSIGVKVTKFLHFLVILELYLNFVEQSYFSNHTSLLGIVTEVPRFLI